MATKWLFQEKTRGVSEELALRCRYQQEGFGLDSAFEDREWAAARIAGLKENHHLTNANIRLVRHTRKLAKGNRITWEVYVRTDTGLPLILTE